MKLKDWKDRLESIEKMKKQAQDNIKLTEKNIMDLDLIISAYKAKIETFK